MTSPITFPTIQPPQLAPNADSGLHDLPQLILAITHGRAQLAQRAQEIELDRQRTESQVSEAGVRTAGEKQKQKAEQQRMDREQEAIQASDIAARHFTNALTSPGGLTSESLNSARLAAGKENSKLAPQIYAAIDRLAEGATKAGTSLAEQRKSKTQATVGEKTQGAQITSAREGARRAVVETRIAAIQERTSAIQERIARAEERLGPGQRTGIMEDMQRSNATLGVVRRIHGVGPIEGVPDNSTFDQITGKQSQQNIVMAETMRAATEVIRSAKDPSLGKAALTELTKATIIGLPVDIFADPFMSDAEKSLVPQYALVAQALNHLVNGARGSDLDFANARRAIVIKHSDPKAVRDQKMIMMDLVPDMLSGDASQSMSERIDGTIARAKARGVAPEILAPFRALSQRSRVAARPDSTELGGVVGEFVRPTQP